MKKEELNETFDNIVASNAQKERIFNNIMNKKNKRFSFKPFMAIFGTLAVGGVCAYAFLFNNGNSMDSSNISLANSYKKEIIINSEKYLESNEIKIDELEVGEKIEISASEIVDDNKYETCSGNLVIRRYNNGFTYSPEITCGTDESKGDESYSIYNGVLSWDTTVYYGTDTIVATSNGEDPDYVIMFDEDGNIKWEYKLETVKEFSNKMVNFIKVIDDKFLICVEEYTDDGYGQEFFIIDKDGKKMSVSENLKNLSNLDLNIYSVTNISSDNVFAIAFGNIYNEQEITLIDTTDFSTTTKTIIIDPETEAEILYATRKEYYIYESTNGVIKVYSYDNVEPIKVINIGREGYETLVNASDTFIIDGNIFFNVSYNEVTVDPVFGDAYSISTYVESEVFTFDKNYELLESNILDISQSWIHVEKDKYCINEFGNNQGYYYIVDSDGKIISKNKFDGVDFFDGNYMNVINYRKNGEKSNYIYLATSFVGDSDTTKESIIFVSK